jgi:hypothetical protein
LTSITTASASRVSAWSLSSSAFAAIIWADRAFNLAASGARESQGTYPRVVAKISCSRCSLRSTVLVGRPIA